MFPVRLAFEPARGVSGFHWFLGVRTLQYIKAHLTIVPALMFREMSTRYGRKPGGYVWALLEPAAYIILMSILFSAISRTPALGVSYPLFFATGRMGYGYFKSVADYVGGSIQANSGLLRYPAVSPFDATVARAILQTATTIVVEGVIAGGIIATLRNPGTIDFAPLLLAIAITGVLGFGVGLLNAGLFIHFPLYEQIYKIVTRPLMLMSGVFFLPDQLPAAARDVILYNPLCHIAILVRQAFYAGYRGTGLDMQYLIVFTGTTFFIGLSVFTLRRKLLRTGRH